MLDDILKEGIHKVSFVQDPFFKDNLTDFPVSTELDESILEETDLVIEAAMADVLKENAEVILTHCDLLVFSVTAFADQKFQEHIVKVAKKYDHTIYLPHGAILGVDGIADGNKIIKQVMIETIKSPKSLGREDKKRAVVYEGCTRGACSAFPRNVNVHATIALAGIGFDKTRSRIISDPAVTTNLHIIRVKGEGIDFTINVSSEAGGEVTGEYTPYSAVSSMHKILDENPTIFFV